jgi:hypothetical protein
LSVAASSQLSLTLSGREIGDWFVEPNVWLGGAAPIELMNRDVEAVLLAARADRFVAAG